MPKKTFEATAAAGHHLIAQVKDNQPTLLDTITDYCARSEPDGALCTKDEGRLRHEIRTYEVFALDEALDGSEWQDRLAAVIRVTRHTNTRSAKTGLWKPTCEVAYHVCDIVPPVERAAEAIRQHWGIENRVHYVRDVSFAEDASRIRKNPGIFARVRSFALNIFRFNGVQNIADARYRTAIGGLAALCAMTFL